MTGEKKFVRVSLWTQDTLLTSFITVENHEINRSLDNMFFFVVFFLQQSLG